MNALRRPSGFSAWLAVLALGTVVLCGGCVSQPSPGGEGVVRTGPPPAYADLAAAHNARVEHLDRVWARTTLRLTGQTAEGEAIDEEAEGHFQRIAPARVSLTVNKLGETYFALGCNAAQYWWIDLRKPRRAWVGAQERASPRDVRKFGLPVHPMDLMELLAINALPVTATEAARWSEDGTRVVVTLPARWGTREVEFDPEEKIIKGVRLFDDDGAQVCESELGPWQEVNIRENTSLRAQMVRDATLRLADGTLSADIRFYEPQNRGGAMKQAAFDFATLLDAYGIADVVNLDNTGQESANRDEALHRPAGAPRARMQPDRPEGDGESGEVK